jgi:ribosome-associated protein
MALNIDVPENSLMFKYSRSSGPGGQNVNKVSTKVTLFFDLPGCAAFSDVQKQRMLKNLEGRINKNGIIKVVSQKYRTQNANRQAAVEKLEQLLAQSLKEKSIRRKTQVPQWAQQKRLRTKRKRSAIKQLRTEKDFEV